MARGKVKIETRQGQIMLLSVLLISTAVLGAASLAGLLVLFQLRQTGDAETSAQAIFAADAGIERVLYERYQNPVVTSQCDAGENVAFEISSESDPDTFTVANIQYLVGGDCEEAKSAALAGRSARALQIYMAGLEAFGGQFLEPPE